MFRKAAPQHKNTFRTHKSVNKANYSAIKKFLSTTLLVLIGIGAIAGIGYGVWKGVNWLFLSAYKPGSAQFTACSQQFTLIKAAPSYGIIFKTNNGSVEKIDITAPDGGGLHSLELEATDWVMVYFSNNFTFSQISEFLRFSKLEKNNSDYCYLLEQLSLTTGAPIEYIIVDDKAEGISSSLPMREIQRIMKQVQDGKKEKFNHKLLPEYLLSDSTKVSVVTYSAMREQFPDFFKIQEISQEQAFVEVYNSTDIDGYASIISRKWAMLGIEISRVGNASHDQIDGAVAVVYVKDETQYVRTLAMIKSSLLGGKVVIKQGRPSNVVTTGDIVVFLLKR